MNDRPAWFAPQRFGIGAGRPIAWQGWALVASFLAALLLAWLLFGSEDLRALAIIVPATLALLVISAATTKGGWRWRWGEEE